jgi:G3E family GTPase
MTDLWAEPIATNLLTGFLGAGKTSLLKRLLGQPGLSDTAVLINEFGEVGIDHLLVEEVDEDVVLLQSGCVCCTIRGDLKEALIRLHGRRQRGEVSPFRRLVIETTGLADPAPIVATLTADPMLRHHFRMGNIIVVIDAVNGAGNLSAFAECRRQVAVADRLVISKIDLAAGDAVAALRSRLATFNPTAEIVETSEEDAAHASLVTRDVQDAEARLQEVRRWLATTAGTAEPNHHSRIDRDRHGGDIRTFVLVRHEPLDWAAFGLWLSMLLNRHGSGILRVKGLLRIAGRDSPIVVQGVQHLIHRPVHLDRWPDDLVGTRLVMIVRGLDPDLVRESFDTFMRLAPPKPETMSEAARPSLRRAAMRRS